MAPETPQNAGYMVAAYVVAPVILGGYLMTLWRRVRRAVGRADHPAVGRADRPAVGRSGGQAIGD